MVVTTGSAPVAEAKHLLLAILDALQEGGDLFDTADALQHAQHRLLRKTIITITKIPYEDTVVLVLYILVWNR